MAENKPTPNNGQSNNPHATGKLELVHEFLPKHIDQIERSGLCADQPRNIEITTEDGYYITPESVERQTEHSRGYGQRLVTQVLADHRPEQYPPRSPAIWIFCQWPAETQMTRRGAVKLDTAELLSDYTLYAADFQIANELYMDSMQEMEFGDRINAERLDNMCVEYWDSVTEINTISDVPETLSEIYIPTRTLSTDYFTTFLHSEDGSDYSVIEK